MATPQNDPEATQQEKNDEQLDEEAEARFVDESPAPDPNPELIPEAGDDK